MKLSLLKLEDKISTPMKILTVIKRHQSNYPHPISFKKGDILSVGRRDEEYEGWLRVTTKDGNEGWAPEQYINVRSRYGIAMENYCAKELDTYVGEQLLVLHELNEWVWVKNSNERCGWVPLKTTK
ncbi:SH3 domain-containing protein [Candidatus Sororendozoicomonas aggregata]|uniref:SH3 domain-containing protein n=1 Tax=Candidatus Sororendozoicomonas aggregata TaxID=3073239 RepID=UPI002ED26C61